MSILFQPLRIRSLVFRNRIVVSPMCQYSAVDGFANDWHLVHLGTRAVGGAGLVMAEATAVSPEGRISPADLGIWDDAHIEPLRRITTFIHQHGSVAGIQLAHAGRKASVRPPWDGGGVIPPGKGGWTTLAPSAIPFREGDPPPREMSRAEIREVIGRFRDGARRAKEAGFRVVEIHAAHGYLLNEFLSPSSNHRRDSYGGDFRNRIRLLLEVIEAVQEVWLKDSALFVRISASDWSDHGWKPEDSVQLAWELRNRGVDLIDCSSGGNVAGAVVNVEPLYQVQFAEKLRKEAGVLTGAVGLITTAQQCEAILQEGRADMIFLARQLLRDPYFPLHAARELGVDIEWPKQYERAK